MLAHCTHCCNMFLQMFFRSLSLIIIIIITRNFHHPSNTNKKKMNCCCRYRWLIDRSIDWFICVFIECAGCCCCCLENHIWNWPQKLRVFSVCNTISCAGNYLKNDTNRLSLPEGKFKFFFDCVFWNINFFFGWNLQVKMA